MVKVKELMIPIGEYVRVSRDDTLADVFLALEQDREAKGRDKHAHRDALVTDGSGAIIGKVTMIDVVHALEPTYAKLPGGDKGTLTGEFVAQIYKDFGLWGDSLETLCSKGAAINVAEVMHRPLSAEFVEAEDDMDQALHRYALDVHQPLLVRDQGAVVGVLRFGDVFEELRRRMLTCSRPAV